MAEKKCPPVGAPMWMATFADMATLLMAFFVLLLSFSTMDAQRFKKMAESVQNAFGVQKEVVAFDIPMGVSVIAQHFSPAMTEPTLLEEVKQSTAQPTTLTLELPKDRGERVQALKLKVSELKAMIVDAKKDEIAAAMSHISAVLSEEINAGSVSVESKDLNIIIRINESGSFSSGSAELQQGFTPVMTKISASIKALQGKIMVGGHTDDIPMMSDFYRSNWELSASRAVTVAHHLLVDKTIDPARIEVEGHADTQPIVLNDSPENRAKNRRVEIILAQDLE